MQMSNQSTMHTRCIKWAHVGRRSRNGGLFPWAKRELKNKTTHHMRKVSHEVREWEQEISQARQLALIAQHYEEMQKKMDEIIRLLEEY